MSNEITLWHMVALAAGLMLGMWLRQFWDHR